MSSTRTPERRPTVPLGVVGSTPSFGLGSPGSSPGGGAWSAAGTLSDAAARARGLTSFALPEHLFAHRIDEVAIFSPSNRVAFLPPGSYTVAFTCGDDDPTDDDVLTFLTPQTVAVQNNLISSANFAPPTP